MTRRSPYVIVLSAADRVVLEERTRACTASFASVVRAKIVLLAADGELNTKIAERLGVGIDMVGVAQAVLRVRAAPGPLHVHLDRRSLWPDRWRHRGAAPFGRGWTVYARSTTIMAGPDSIDAGVAFLRDEVMSDLLGMNGCVGLSILVDRTSGRCIATSAWEDEDSMRASDEQLRPMRSRMVEQMGGGDLQVEEWEIAALHRDHTSQQGACVRCTWVRFDTQQADRALDVYKMAVLPRLEQLDGFCSASLLRNRQAGLAVGTVTFDSREAMERTRDQAASVRERAVQEMGVEVVEVAEFELALAHLRVPEMA